MTKVLVTGGCGYIGSHTLVDLEENNFTAICLDNLSRSDGSAIDGVNEILNKKLVNHKIELCNLDNLRRFFKEQGNIECIIHFAAFKYVDESVKKPLLYFENNNNSLINLLHCVEEFSVKNFVFSSSCSVYGNTETLPVDENTPLLEAQSPYARTKQMGEEIIRDFSVNSNCNFILLRYFNPVGAHISALIGESPAVIPNNLVPRITGTVLGKFKKLSVFGFDLPTRDGTCIRDYIHVMDIAHAHTLALKYLLQNKNENRCEVFNLGSGNGVSVLEAIKAFEKVSGKKVEYELAPPREGDVIAVYADNSKARNILNWQPQYSVDDMLLSAWNWELKNCTS